MNSFVIVLLAVSAVTAEKFCSPNAVFKQSCNLCVCSPDGEKAACTDMMCPEDFTRSLSADPAPKFCEPGKRFQMDETSSCTCNADGTSAMCTLGARLQNNHLFNARKNANFCSPGKSFKPDSCNTCRCSEDGLSAFCTLILCPKDQNEVATERKQVCTPKSSFNDYCNTCACADDGLSYACTKMFCDKQIWNQDGSLRVRVKSEGSEETAPKQVCTPKSSFNDYCNTCACADDGLSYACTKMFCDKQIWNQDGSLRVRVKSEGSEETAPKQVCTPKSSFNDYCNTCACADDGLSYACTRMFCDTEIWNQDGSLKIKPKNDKFLNPKQVCTPLTNFKDYCNNCFCAADGSTYACTRMYCDKDIWNKDGTLKVKIGEAKRSVSVQKQVCTPLTNFKDYCNNCFCAADGSTYACTRMYCDKDIWNKDGTLKVKNEEAKRSVSVQEQVCTPLSQFMDYCNSCFCAADGMSAICTRMFCDKDIWNKDGTLKNKKTAAQKSVSTPKQVCTPLSTFMDYCNHCFCGADGMTFACTAMFCDKNVWNKDGSKKQGVESRICTPNTYFKEYCNTCKCSSDGLSKGCTFMACDLDVWNKDGSLKVGIQNLNSALKQESTVEQEEHWGPAYHQGDACTPGQVFYSECNKCVCMDNGNSAFCTMMMCPSRT